MASKAGSEEPTTSDTKTKQVPTNRMSLPTTVAEKRLMWEQAAPKPPVIGATNRTRCNFRHSLAAAPTHGVSFDDLTPAMQKLMLSSSTDPNAVDRRGENSVFRAVRLGYTEDDLKEVVRLGGDWRMKTLLGESVLHVAAAEGNVVALKYFIALGADIHGRDVNQNTVLHSSKRTEQNFLLIVRYLLEKGLEINEIDKNGNNLIFLAVAMNKSKGELEELVNLGADWKIRNNKEKSILHMVGSCGNLEAFKYFVQLGADVNLVDNEKSVSFLHPDLWKDDFLGTLRFLRQFNVNINGMDPYKYNVVFLAVKWGRPMEEVEELVRLGCDWKMVRPTTLMTILHHAGLEGNCDTIKYFVSLGANINSKDVDGETVMHKIRKIENVAAFAEVVEFLVSHGGDINAVCKSDHTLRTRLVQSKAHGKLQMLEKYEPV